MCIIYPLGSKRIFHIVAMAIGIGQDWLVIGCHGNSIKKILVHTAHAEYVYTPSPHDKYEGSVQLCSWVTPYKC